MPAGAHRRVEGPRRVARVHEGEAALGHGEDLAREEVEDDFRRAQALVAGAEQEARVHQDEPPPLAAEVLEGDALLINLARVVGPARDDVERRGPLLVGRHVAVLGDGHRPARRGHDDGADAGRRGRLAQQARALDVQAVHLVRVLRLARDAPGQMVDLAHAFQCPRQIFRRSHRAADGLDAQLGEPPGLARRQHADVADALRDEQPDEVRAEEARPAGHERGGARRADERLRLRRGPFGRGLFRRSLACAFGSHKQGDR